MTTASSISKANATEPNGGPLTVAQLAEAKRLPLDFLTSLDLIDTPYGVGIPCHDPAGNELFIRERLALEKSAGRDNRFRQPKGVGLAAYGQNRLDIAAKARYLFLVEGESDCWTLWHHGKPALGLPGVNAACPLKKEHIESLDTKSISTKNPTKEARRS